jgi:hypothetical protein
MAQKMNTTNLTVKLMWPAVVLAGGMVAAPGAFANSALFDFGPNGTTLMTALFQDAGPGQVDLTVTAVNLDANNSVNSLFFCLNPLLDAKDLVFTQTDPPGGAQGVVSLGNDSFKVGGGGKFDIDMSFGPTPAFDNGDMTHFTISGISGLTVNDFLFQETASAGHSQCYAQGSLLTLDSVVIVDGSLNRDDGPNVSVPDGGATAGLLAMGLAGVGLFARKVNRKVE